MKIMGDKTYFVDGNIHDIFVARKVTEDGRFAIGIDGRTAPCASLYTKAMTFSLLMGAKMNHRYVLEDAPYYLYAVKEHGIFEIVKGVEYDITNRLLDTPLKDVIFKKKKLIEQGEYTPLSEILFQIKKSRVSGDYSISYTGDTTEYTTLWV